MTSSDNIALMQSKGVKEGINVIECSSLKDFGLKRKVLITLIHPFEGRRMVFVVSVYYFIMHVFVI